MNLINYTIQECFYRRIKETPQALAYRFGEHEYSWAEAGKISLALAEELRRQEKRTASRLAVD